MKYTRSRRIALLFLPVVVAILGVAAANVPVMAASCGDLTTAVVDCGSANDSTGSPVVAILVIAIQILTGAVGVVAIGALVYAGMMYSSASSNAAQVTKAKELIRNTVIGLVVFALMTVGLHFLIPGGLFSGSTKFGAGGNGLGKITPIAVEQPRKQIGSDDDNDSNNNSSLKDVAGECYNVKVTKSDINVKRFHRSGSQPYALENSFEGIDYALKHGYKAIDLDIMVTKDGAIVVTHGWYPLKSGKMGGFVDTAGKIKDKNRRIQSMTLAEVRRLKHKDGGYRISTLEEMIDYAKGKKLVLGIEVKNNGPTEKQMPQIAALLNKANVKAGFMFDRGKSGQASARKTARSLNFYTRYVKTSGGNRAWVAPTGDSPLCKQ